MWQAAHCSLWWILSCSVHSLLLQPLRFVSDGYFYTSFEVTGACIVGADKRTILNSQIKTEFNFSHLLLTDSYDTVNGTLVQDIAQQFLNFRSWLLVMGWWGQGSSLEFKFNSRCHHDLSEWGDEVCDGHGTDGNQWVSVVFKGNRAVNSFSLFLAKP